MLENLTRPLVLFDLETTGTDVVQDRIVQIATVKVTVGATNADAREHLVNPGVPIPKEATAIHGIGEKEIDGAPYFRQLARGLADYLKDCDLGGYNIRRFDLPILVEEFRRAGVPFDPKDYNIVDLFEIWNVLEPRTLTGFAERWGVPVDTEKAHSAIYDTLLVFRSLPAFLGYYNLQEATAQSLDSIGRKGVNTIDLTGRFRWNDENVAVFNFGKHEGEPIHECISYLEWMLKQSFPYDVLDICERVCAGEVLVR